jgi:hypothetical protein
MSSNLNLFPVGHAVWMALFLGRKSHVTAGKHNNFVGIVYSAPGASLVAQVLNKKHYYSKNRVNFSEASVKLSVQFTFRNKLLLPECRMIETKFGEL